MHKLLSISGAAALVLAFTLSAATPTLADSASDAAAAGIVGGVFGFMAGAAAASSPGPVYYHHPRQYDDYEEHVQACEDAYGWRYDPDTDLVTRHHRSFPCEL